MPFIEWGSRKLFLVQKRKSTFVQHCFLTIVPSSLIKDRTSYAQLDPALKVIVILKNPFKEDVRFLNFAFSLGNTLIRLD